MTQSNGSSALPRDRLDHTARVDDFRAWLAHRQAWMIKLLYVAAAYLVILSGVALGDAMHLSEASVRRTTRVIERPLPSKSADLGTVYETYEPILMPNCIEQG